MNLAKTTAIAAACLIACLIARAPAAGAPQSTAEIHRAAKSGDLAKVRELVEKDPALTKQ